MSTAKNAPAKAPAYENNPFFVAVNGLELLFKKAKVIGIILAFLMVLSALTGFIPTPADTSMTKGQVAQEDQALAENFMSIPGEAWLLIGGIALLIIAALVVLLVAIQGVIDYTSTQMANNKEVTFSEAVRAVFAKFWGYLWLQIVITTKVLLWSLLLIIPGLIMAVRYSLSGPIYFDKGLKANAATKESARLTKGVWLTTFASHSLFNIITLGLMELVLTPGTNAVLYRQYRDFDAKGIAKPNAHVLSWLTLILPFVLIVSIITLVFMLAAVFSTP